MPVAGVVGIMRLSGPPARTAGAPPSLRCSRMSLNWPLRTRINSSIPAMVIAAVLNGLNPGIGTIWCCTSLRSCSIRSIKYFYEHGSVSAGSSPSPGISSTDIVFYFRPAVASSEVGHYVCAAALLRPDMLCRYANSADC